MSRRQGPGRAGWRRSILWRETDEHVRAAVPGISALTVAASMLGRTPLRMANLLLAAGGPVDRSGSPSASPSTRCEPRSPG